MITFLNYIILSFTIISTYFIIYVIFCRFKLQKEAVYFACKRTEWDKLIFPYFSDDIPLDQITRSVGVDKTIFLKYLLNFVENLEGDELSKVEVLWLNLELDKTLLEMIQSNKREQVLDGYKVLRVFGSRRKSLYTRFDAYLKNVSKTTDFTFSEFPGFDEPFIDFFYRIICGKALSPRRILFLLNEYKTIVHDDIMSLLLSGDVSDFHQSVLVEFLTERQLFSYNMFLEDKFELVTNSRLRCKIVDYFTAQRSKEIYNLILGEIASEVDEVTLLYYIRYLKKFAPVPEKTVLFLLLNAQNLWLKEELIKEVRLYSYIAQVEPVSCGVITDEFEKAVKERFHEINK